MVGSCYVWGSRGEGVLYETQGLTPPQPPNVTRRGFRGTRKDRVRLARSLEKASSRPDLARRSTGAGPDTVWTGVGVVLDSAGGHLGPFPALRGTSGPYAFLVVFAGFLSVPPKRSASGGRSLQDLAFLLPYRSRHAKIHTREPARLMPNPCDIFRGGPVRRSPASPRARESPRSTKRGILDKIASYFVQ